MPPGRGPRWTRSVGGAACLTSARRTAPIPSLRQRGEMPTTTSVAGSTTAMSPSSVGSARRGSAPTPTRRCTDSDASARSLVVSRLCASDRPRYRQAATAPSYSMPTRLRARVPPSRVRCPKRHEYAVPARDIDVPREQGDVRWRGVENLGEIVGKSVFDLGEPQKDELDVGSREPHGARARPSIVNTALRAFADNDAHRAVSEAAVVASELSSASRRR